MRARKPSTKRQREVHKLWAATIAAFRATDDPCVVALLEQSRNARAITLAWRHGNGRVTGPDLDRATTRWALRPQPDETSLQAWEWLWEVTPFDRLSLLEASGVLSGVFDLELARVIANRLIYPDGTVNTFVDAYMRAASLRAVVKVGGHKAMTMAASEVGKPPHHGLVL